MMSKWIYKSYTIIHPFKIMNKKNNEEKNSLIIVIWSDFSFKSLFILFGNRADHYLVDWGVQLLDVSDVPDVLEKALSLFWDMVAGNKIGKALSTFSQEIWSRECLLCESHYFLNPNDCNSVPVGSKAGWGLLFSKNFQKLPETLAHAQRQDSRIWPREHLPLLHASLGTKSFPIRNPGKSEHCSDIPVRLFQTWCSLLNV